MAKTDRGRYVKLGEKALSFFDPVSKLKLIPGKVVFIETRESSNRIKNAISKGHLVIATVDEYEECERRLKKAKREISVEKFDQLKKAEKDNTELRIEIEELKKTVEALIEKGKEDEDFPEFSNMTEEELNKYYSENWEVSEDEIEVFGELSYKKKIIHLKDLEKEAAKNKE